MVGGRRVLYCGKTPRTDCNFELDCLSRWVIIWCIGGNWKAMARMSTTIATIEVKIVDRMVVS